jgi:6-phosphogluconolactonase (cycloisomerase 2 family)
MNRISVCQGNNVRRTREALSVFAVMLFGLVCLGSAAASDARYAYVPGNNGMSIYTVNGKTGQLRSNGYFYPGSALGYATIDPSQKFLYALGSATLGPNSISAFTIDATTGALTEVSSSPYATGNGPVSVTVDPQDKFVYVPNDNSNNISAYTIDSDTGALTPVHGSPFAAGDEPLSVVIDPTDSFAYVNNVDDSPGGDVSGYTINATTGVLTAMPGSPFLSRSGAFAVVIAPSGKFGYVSQPGEVTIFSINATTGIPTAVGSPFAVEGTSFESMVMAPSGKFIFIPGFTNPGTVAAVKVNPTTGALSAVSGSPVASGDSPSSATVDPGGKLLYVTNSGSGEVWTYSIAASGKLTLLDEVRTARASAAPVSLTTGSAAVAYTPKFAYVANQGSGTVPSTVSAYTIASSGHLSAVSGSPFADGGSGVFAFANSVTVDPSGRFAYVANGNTNNVAAYTIDASTGALTEIGSPVAAETNPFSVAVDPSGRFLYVANNGSYNISGFAINSSTGALTALGSSPFSTGTTSAGPVSVTVDPTGQFVYVANSSLFDGSISALAIDPATGALTSVSGSPFADTQDPGSVAVDASGRAVFVANLEQVPESGGQYKMLAFTIAPGSGALTNPFPTVNVGASTPSVVTDPLGRFLYSPQNAEGGILSFSFNTQTLQFSFPIDAPNICVDNDGPTSMTVDMSGKFVYVANLSTNNVTACKIDQTTGDLNNIAGESAIPAGANPLSVVTTGTIH